jgi:hypothetical protein
MVMVGVTVLVGSTKLVGVAVLVGLVVAVVWVVEAEGVGVKPWRAGAKACSSTKPRQ